MAQLRALGSEEDVEGMKRYGVGGKKAFGVRAPMIRSVARTIGTEPDLARGLWETGWRECRIVAAMISDPEGLSDSLMDAWVRDIDSWDVCDGVCNELFRRSPRAWTKAVEWSHGEETFVKRAGFVLMAQLAVHDKKATDDRFVPLLDEIERGSNDPRPMVAKGVNWALRQIGKRSAMLHKEAVAAAERIGELKVGRARWVASDALRELRSEAVLRRVGLA